MSADTQRGGRKITCIAAHIPHSGYSEEDMHMVYDQLRILIEEARRPNIRTRSSSNIWEDPD